MTRRVVGHSGCLLVLVGLAGCSGSASGGADPRSDAPELEGRWCLTGDEQGFVGFFEMDETGDPVRLVDNAAVRDALQEDFLQLDGVTHSTDSGLLYNGIASAKLDGADVELFAEIHFFAFGSFEVGALVLGFEGERVSVDALEGVVVTVQDFIDREVVPLNIETATATRDTCE